MLVKIIICLLIGYAFGCIQTGYIYGRMHGIDIREYGSGNAGTTNVMRTLGKKAGYITYAGDVLKGIIAIVIVRLIIENSGIDVTLLTMYTGFGVVLGHNFPFYLHFKGGKGIAVTSGVMFAFDWRFALIALIVFGIIFFTTRYVSVGSLAITLLFPICCLIFYFGQWHLFILSVLFWAMAWWRHKANIVRLIHGNENKFERKSKKKE